jgi:hypothetical protein
MVVLGSEFNSLSNDVSFEEVTGGEGEGVPISFAPMTALETNIIR